MEMDLKKRLEEAKQTYRDMEAIATAPKIKEWYLLKQSNRIRRIEEQIAHELDGIIDVGGVALVTGFGLSTELGPISNETTPTR
jgi:hypothetical protein